ncbi:spore germination protein GerPB [Caldibacillus lycopersici]|uniref:Spore germination protein GerPB n=1 Tax=Perspicuibacillus lycopersici TaxID=1325689 RepID=A0AAE3IQ37_9BACI|nr:spore germination protein GerPB [Perspicuibacillus lycopersici]MCU9612473.1 spore germination protein GerPB [Perspicuibacillus lycopersici]
MNFYIQQSIQINILRVESISNSSVLQIGSAGIIKSRASLANTGGYTEQAPKPEHEGFVTPTIESIPVPFQP